MHEEGAPVGSVLIDDSIGETIKRLLDVLPTTEFSGDLEGTVRAAYAPGRTYGEAFARMMTALVGAHGLVLLDPLDARLKKLAAPLYSEAARRAPEIAAAVEARSRQLVEAGYHAQVHASADAFPLFLHADGARRVALARGADGRYRAKGAVGTEGYTADELGAWALSEPESFSPNVTLRAVVQDYLLPTVAYYGGAAEIAYFAQTAEVYRVLSRPATPILHRASLTLVERRTVRTLERYDLKLEDFFAGLDPVIARVVEEHLGAEQARAFDRSEEKIKGALAELGETLRGFDPTLADALAAHRQLERAAALLYPEKALQERHLNITSLVARHGVYCLDWIFSAIDIGSSDHQIVYL
jgi:bacillithiol biosynthesis cysteine-adding enzyme BshC